MKEETIKDGSQTITITREDVERALDVVDYEIITVYDHATFFKELGFPDKD